ncbi:polysaccharide biosynthesis C-terminal domain-containing protein [Desulfosarcina cetonica]|uniref:oligosaccharide flippase family protein n=1 Tax=Desulfosarcina cetonica TaxID=90730 RepID=UPI0006D28D96|nr:polysaccharide biosynthesis C-terminal domain-containing protein [Desulfosarcina cetonica]
MAVIGIVLCIFFCLWGLWYGSALGPEGSEPQKRYILFLLILGAQLIFVFPGYAAESYLEGFQKYYLKNNITIFNTLVSSAILYKFINPGNGLLLLAGCNAIGLSVKYLVFMWLLTRSAFGGLKVSLRSFSYSKLKEMLVFSSKSLVQGISARIENRTDALVIGFFLGPAMVPLYIIPCNLVQYIRTFGWNLTHAFMPLFSNLSARNEHETISSLYLIGSKYVVAIVTAMAVGVGIVGGPFIILWIGPEFRDYSDIIVGLLTIFIAGPFMNPFGGRYLTAIGKHGIFARLSPVQALLNLGLSLSLVDHYGILGVAFASTVQVFIFVPIYLRYSCKNLGIPVTKYINRSVLPSFLPAVVLAFVVSMFRYNGWLTTYPMMLVSIIVSSIAWIVVFWFMALINTERSYLLARMRGRKELGYPGFNERL